MTDRSLHLASASPRRREILTALGLEFTAAGVDLDESRREAELPEAFVVRLAEEKALAARPTQAEASAVILGADTAVVVDGEIFGKPANQTEGTAMLLRLAGRSHEVLTGVAIVGPDGLAARCSPPCPSYRGAGAACRVASSPSVVTSAASTPDS